MKELKDCLKWEHMPKTSAVKPRRVKTPTYKHFRLTKRIKHPNKLPSAYKIFKSAFKTIKTNWRLFLIVTLIYGLLTIVLVRGLGGSLNLAELKSSFQEGSYNGLSTGLSLFGVLLGTAGSSSNPGGSVYQAILIVIISLVVIWALRQVQAGHKVKTKQAFYESTYPLIPFILVLLVIGLQLIPLAIGSWLYSTVVNAGIAIAGIERFVWALLSFMLVLLSFYMITSSIFALYIVTLPNMTPLKALRSARQLVLNRRWSVLLKVIYLPIVLLIIGVVIMLPVLLLATVLAEWLFFLLSMFTLVVVHSYLYTLYRELL